MVELLRQTVLRAGPLYFQAAPHHFIPGKDERRKKKGGGREERRVKEPETGWMRRKKRETG